MAKNVDKMQPGEMHLSPYGFVRAEEKVVDDVHDKVHHYHTVKVISVDKQITKGKPTLLHGMAAALARAGLKN